MRRFLVPLALLSLAGCAREEAPLITVTNARVIVLPSSAAAYFTLTNSGGADRLQGVDAPGVGGASLHETVMEGDVMRMNPIAGGVDVPARGTVSFSPHGKHVMIMPDRPIAAPTMRLVLHFERQGDVTINAPTTGPGN